MQVGENKQNNKTKQTGKTTKKQIKNSNLPFLLSLGFVIQELRSRYSAQAQIHLTDLGCSSWQQGEPH